MNLRSIARILVTRPKLVLIIFTIFTVIIGSQATNIYMESDLTTFLPSSDPAVQLWNQIEDDFQIGKTIIIYVETDDIRDPEVLKEMDRVSSSPLVDKYESDNGIHDGIYSVSSLAKFIKIENAKPEIPGELGGNGLYEIPHDQTTISRYMSRFSIQELKGT